MRLLFYAAAMVLVGCPESTSGDSTEAAGASPKTEAKAADRGIRSFFFLSYES